MSHVLIAYYSQANGNTRSIAKRIHEKCGYDLFEIETMEPYQGSYDEIVERGKWEVEHHFEPELKADDIDISHYDTIILGTPTWWYTMAPAMFCFIKQHYWENRKVIPFQTHGGWPGHTIEDIKQLCQGAMFQYERAIQFDSQGGNRLITKPEEIDDWITLLMSL